MGDLSGMEELNRLTMERARVEGFGLDVTQHLPCPFCAHPDWLVVKIVHFGQRHEPPTCESCGRRARLEHERSGAGVRVWLVQTEGPDAPEWMTVAPERVPA